MELRDFINHYYVKMDAEGKEVFKNYLSENFWTRPLIEEDDTAESARRLSQKKLPETAGVIANKACADIYGLEVLEKSIHDLKHNLTLFIGVCKLDLK